MQIAETQSTITTIVELTSKFLGNGLLSKLAILNYVREAITPPPLEREDRLRKHPFAGFCTVMEDIKRNSYTKNQPILLASQ